MTKVAIILPSRGLIFSRTAEEILTNAKEIKHQFFFSHRKPLPDCFETPTNRALLDETVTHLLFVEDDMIIPPHTFLTMLQADKEVVTYDYPVLKTGQGSVFNDASGKPVFCGTGCLLVKRQVFDKIDAPYFATDIAWTVLNYGKALKFIAHKGSNAAKYGGHDVNFCMKLNKARIPITVLDGVLGQRKLLNLGKTGSNDGAHNIEEWTKVKKDMYLKKLKKTPVTPTGNLVTIDTPSGGVTTTKKHADNLVKQGLGSYPKREYIIVDDSEINE